jgi:beta-glucanase (GH16 family)
MRRILVAVVALVLSTGAARAQVGNLIWEDDFNDLGNWIELVGNGSWGWGNGELEYYLGANVDIAAVPGETGNNALRIVARQESGAGITDQWGNPLNYTSGRVMSKSFVSVRYGMIETRVWVPDLNLGGWPAAWLLGTSNYAWPRCGEIDMMEMGMKKAYRDLHDTHNGGNGLDNSTVNQCTGANALFYSAAAVTPENPSGAASLSWDPTDVYCRYYYDHANPMNGRFLVYRLYWSPDSLRQTVVDAGVEHDLFATPFAIDSASAEFREPFYFVFNLAVGGAFTDAQVLGAGGLPVTMPFPATMYVDYVRVYQWKGQGEVHLGPPTPYHGTFGLFTDTTPTDASLLTDSTSKIFVWESTLVPGTITPYEGSNVLAWRTNGKGWFGAGIMSLQPLNLFHFPDGHLKFRIKIPANVTFKIGVIDSWGNQYYVPFPANTTRYGLTRNSEWGQASIPVSDLRGTAIDMRMLSYAFVILEEQGTGCEFAIDDVYYDGGEVTAVGDPVPAPQAGVRLANAPNPFHSSTELRFELGAAGPYEIEVYDVAGKHVTGFRGTGRAGANTVRWDGRDDQGRDAGAGVYYFRMTAGGRSASRRMVLVR